MITFVWTWVRLEVRKKRMFTSHLRRDVGFHYPPSSSCQILDPSQVFHNIGNGDVKPISPLIGKMSLPFTAWRLSSHLHEMIYLQKNNNFWQHCGNHHWLMFDGNLVLCMALTNPIYDVSQNDNLRWWSRKKVCGKAPGQIFWNYDHLRCPIPCPVSMSMQWNEMGRLPFEIFTLMLRALQRCHVIVCIWGSNFLRIDNIHNVDFECPVNTVH